MSVRVGRMCWACSGLNKSGSRCATVVGREDVLSVVWEAALVFEMAAAYETSRTGDSTIISGTDSLDFPLGVRRFL